MTAPKSDLRKLIDQTQALPDDVVLGNILWYSVEDRPYDIEAATKAFDNLNLNPALLPVDNKSINAWEKAASSIHGIKYPTPTGLEAELLVHEVYRDEEMVQRQVTRKIRDSQNRVLDFGKVAELVFYRDSTRGGKVQRGTSSSRETLEPNLDGWERAQLQPYLDQVAAKFIEFRDTWDGPKIRTMLRHYVEFLNGVMMRAGVYFVHSNRSEELSRLQQFATGLEGTSMSLFPLPDLKALREEVIEAFQNEAVQDLTDVIQQINKVRATRQKISPDMHRKVKAQYDKVLGKAREYERTLKISQVRTGDALDLAREELIQMEKDMIAQMGG